MKSSTTSSLSSIAIDQQAAFYSSYECDDTTSIDILPNFTSKHTVPLLSSAAPIGPFTAGVVVSVPLWVGCILQQRTLCRIILPEWLSTSNIVTIIEFEKSNPSLYANTANLPFHYYELSKRLLTSSSTTTASGGSTSNSTATTDAIQLLIEDLFEIRMDKLRQQFQELVTTTVPDQLMDLTADITGIAAQEVALLRRFVTAALTDYRALATTRPPPHKQNATSTTTESNTTAAAAILKPSKFKLRQFRK